MRGFYGSDRTVARWCSRRVLEHARRRALAKARQQITAVGLPDFVAFLQRWQHLDPRDRLGGTEGVSVAVRQLAASCDPPSRGSATYLPARVRPYDAAALSALTQSGAVVWIGDGVLADGSDARALTGVRFVERGTAALWVTPGGADASSATRAR